MSNIETRLKELPDKPGVYIMRDSAGRIIYIGKASSLKKRVASYFRGNTSGLKNALLVKTLRNIDYIVTNNTKEALIFEESLIKRFLPKYNVMWKDDKKYPFLKITDEGFPRIAVERKIRLHGRYFGPYPDVTDMKKTLGFLYKTFRIRPCKYNIEKRKEPCLYYSIRKCSAPCIENISKEDYTHNINDAAMFLSGRNKELLKSIEQEMTDAKNKLDFEKAAQLRDKLFAIKNTLEKINFRQITSEELLLNIDPASYTADLSKLLNKKINRIEGFDISNIGGDIAVGSMVVFEDGVPQKNEYRKFKIKTVKYSNDFEMLKEVVGRRYLGTLSKTMGKPDLIVIDGGKGQLSAAFSVINKTFEISGIPAVVGIAKKKEELFFPGRPEPVVLPKNSLALNIIRHIRDEAHRFAISYHKLLRGKIAAVSVLIIISLSVSLFCRNGTIYLKNGRSISGNIEMSYDKYIVETRTFSISFSENEIKSIKYSKERDTSAKNGNKSFVSFMKNTKRLKTPAMLKKNNYEYDHLIHLYARKYDLDPAFVKAVMEAESNFDPSDISCKGAIGLMQIMPETARTMNINPKNIEENIEGGAKYLNYMVDRFGDLKLAVAAYNAGPNAVKKYGNNIPPYKETREYVERVLKNYRKHKADNQMWYYVDASGSVHIADYPKDIRYRRVRK